MHIQRKEESDLKKIKLNCAVLCEGKYDKIKLSSVLDAQIFTTDGFSVFNNSQKKAMLRKLCEARGLVIITDSDRAGGFIRSKLKGMLPAGKVKNIYIPQIRGKEKRKTQYSKDGFLGVEGMSPDTLREVFARAGLTEDPDGKSAVPVTKAQLYSLGLSGQNDSAEKREKILKKLELPCDLTANAMLSAFEMLGVEYADLCKLCEQTFAEDTAGGVLPDAEFFDFFPEDVLKILEILIKSGYSAHFVGGCVRDYLMGIAPHDFDITTNASSDEIISAADSCGAQATLVGGSCGTVLLKYGECEAEITPYRAEGAYNDHRHPSEVVFVKDIKEDLSRRDFTVNALALTFDGKNIFLTDNFDGLSDISNHVIKCVGHPDTRFYEDALRILRALRFAVRLGFDISPETAASITKNAHLLSHISAERKSEELRKILVCARVFGVLREFPEVFSEIVGNFSGNGIDAVPPVFTCRMFYLLRFFRAEDIKKLLCEMKLSGAEQKDILQFKDIFDTLEGAEDIQREKGIELIAKYGEFFEKYLEIFGKSALFEDIFANPEIPKSIKQLDISGNDLAALGLCGKDIGNTLDALLIDALSGRTENKKSELLKAVCVGR
ncbi:MAG: DUF4093 domain-containing protein [Clostridia bacterium]|nr:DUF4093 domain-containing protein [Clostridia bacterium]